MKDNLIQIILKVLTGSIVVVGVILFLLIIAGKGTDADGNAIVADGEIGFAITFCMILFLSAAVVAVVAGIFMIAINIKKSVPLLIGIGVFLVVLFLSYSLSSDEILEAWKYKASAELYTAGNVKWSDAGIISMYFFGAAAILAIIAGEISGIVKRFTK